MKKRTVRMITLLMLATLALSGCGQRSGNSATEQKDTGTPSTKQEQDSEQALMISVDENVTELEPGLSVVQFNGNYGFDAFLEQGGAETDRDAVSFLTKQVLSGIGDLIFDGLPFGCSTLSVENPEGGYFFGRNFDWNTCDAMIVKSRPDTGYASVSTVNLDFVKAGGADISKYPDNIQAMVALYAPLDGMNDQGFAVSVNMIEDSAAIEQDTNKPDITTTTAIRLLLNQAAKVEEAIELLQEYDMHGSMGMMVHFAMADATGRSVVVEYVDNEMVVTDTPVVTNFYFAEGSKYGKGSSQSHMRYDILDQKLKETPAMNEAQVTEAMDSVSKDNFTEFESTEWTIIMNQETKELTYYHRENYENGYRITVE